ncbi:MAG: ABC transporter permease [Polyangiales bacterium]
MMRYLLRRLGWAVFVVSLVTTGTFVLLNVVGDPAKAKFGGRASAAVLAEFRAKHGLDRPAHQQFAAYLGVSPCLRRSAADDPYAVPRGAHCGLLQGDLGRSYTDEQPVSQLIAARMPRTILLGMMAMVVEVLLGVSLGIAAAVFRGGLFDRSVMTGTVLTMSLPTFVTGPAALMILAFLFGLFPLGGYGTDALDHVRHGLLPALVLGIGGASGYARIMRTEMLDTLRADYVRTARAKGLSPGSVVVHHAFRNALLPLVTLLGLSLPGLVGGAIITEAVFGWPGIGRLTVEALNNVDRPTVMAVVLIASVAVQLGNLLADVLVAALDPRVRTQ